MFKAAAWAEIGMLAQAARKNSNRVWNRKAARAVLLLRLAAAKLKASGLSVPAMYPPLRLFKAGKAC